MTQKGLFTTKITMRAIMIILLASCFYFYEFILQVAPGAIAQDLLRDFAIDAAKLGLISSCFYYAYTPLQLTTGLLLDRYSARIILTCVCALCAFGALLFAHAPNFYVAAIARLIMGGASSCAFIGVLHLAARWVPPTSFALFAGIVEMMGAIGGGIGNVPFAFLVKYFDWRTTIAGLAYVGFFLALLIAILIRNQPANLKPFLPLEKKQNFIWNNLKMVLSSRETLAIGIYSFCIWAPVLGFAVLWGATFLRLSCNLDNLAATSATTYVWIGIAIASPFIGWLSDFIGKRCLLMTICALTGTIAIAIVIFITNLHPWLLNSLMFAVGLASAGQTLAFALIKDTNAPTSTGTANGFNNMCVVAGGLLFPILIGKILVWYWPEATAGDFRAYDLHSYKVALSTLPICYVIAAITSIFFIKETNCLAVWQNKK